MLGANLAGALIRAASLQDCGETGRFTAAGASLSCSSPGVPMLRSRCSRWASGAFLSLLPCPVGHVAK